MKKTLFFSMFCLLFSTSATEAAENLAAPHWGYQGVTGPDEWARLTPEFGQCAGSYQSPVDLVHMVDAKLESLIFNYQAGGNMVINNGHTIQITYAPGSTLKVDGMTFELKQFHFHAPSENLIEGKSYPLEGHLVHVSDKGEIAVVAVMFEAGKTNSAIAEAWSVLPAKVSESHALNAPFAVEKILPKSREYYRYSGSLTTPPCSEGVRWLVMKEVVELSQAQIYAFKAVTHAPNSRPVQPLNGRVILK